MDDDPQPSTSAGFGHSTDHDPSTITEPGPGASTVAGAGFSSSTDGGRSTSSEVGSSSSSSPSKHTEVKKYKVDKQDLRQRLSTIAYTVTQERGTELPFSGDLLYTNDSGSYCCLICDAELFSSKTKYDAKCGWPSFYDSIDKTRITITPDLTASRTRLEVTCARCDAHLGHVFEKEPTPTGTRYCINSCALVFRQTDEGDTSDPVSEKSDISFTPEHLRKDPGQSSNSD